MIFDRKNFCRKLLRWYDKHQRELPWRTPRDTPKTIRPNPYHVLVSEAMLQQTQVSTVIPYFKRFIAQFPTVKDLSSSDEQAVLRLWQGLGYYSRARNLRKTAIVLMQSEYGQIPQSVEALMRLPGIGRYTAGAVASIAFNKRAPILDGNVARVFCRIDLVRSDPSKPRTREKLWSRAAQILPDWSTRYGDINSALMELGATVCTPRSPSCLSCPIRDMCHAYAAGVQDKIPLKRTSKQTPLVSRSTYCVRNGSKWLIEQRPQNGRWARLWQFVTLDPETQQTPPASATTRLATLEHQLTHRRYRFQVFRCEVASLRLGGHMRPRKWVRLSDLSRYPLSKPQLQIAALLAKSA